ncbi:GNAT family N-acetyltransferase [Brevundimonas basaltis]|uniref:RimJ/RimL family protein N-acetyltransferase n=1 Tax=Brevundimonas basaltis TaxID=472166 RepID=A0A7W8HYP0_9CAUL|nr:GNAT family N-acetyltransferase [Brevundimonas basaltis]MBB5292235.1 RimJ/RimL family protein N-acetyltransferase [Brevundimonas basaltis]
MTTLITERLTLTPVAASDYDDLRAMWADPEVIRYIFPDPLTGEDVWFRLLRDIGHWEVLGHGNWTLRLKDTGEHVGSVGVLDFHRVLEPALDAPELGWGLRSAFQGKGLAFEALSAALAWCDDALNAPRTVCMIDPANAPSIALAKRAGYREYARTDYKGAPVILLERRST